LFGCFYYGLFFEFIIAIRLRSSSFGGQGVNDEKLLGFPGAFAAECVSDCDASQLMWGLFLRLRTSPERIAAESLTLPSNRFRSPQHLA